MLRLLCPVPSCPVLSFFSFVSSFHSQDRQTDKQTNKLSLVRPSNKKKTSATLR